MGVPLMCLHVGKRNNSQKGYVLQSRKVNKLQMKNSVTENKQNKQKGNIFALRSLLVTQKKKNKQIKKG